MKFKVGNVIRHKKWFGRPNFHFIGIINKIVTRGYIIYWLDDKKEAAHTFNYIDEEYKIYSYDNSMLEILYG